ncbi:HIT family protein [Candidatus Woesearchaeota archaeon]|nr:HIT family protein [Candidatus Woesearchaeota archaeon]
MQEELQEKKPQKLEANLDDNCIFCRIVEGKIPCARVFEDDKVLSFLDIAPANKGHVLIITKNHYETLLDIPDNCLDDLMIKARKTARAMSSALGCEGFNVLMNGKKVAGQLVPHAHVHIIPRFSGDRISLNWKPRRYKDKEINEFRERIKSFL